MLYAKAETEMSDLGLRSAIELAKLQAKNSNDEHTKVGAALLVMRPDSQYRVASLGHNQIVDRGDKSSFERPTKYSRVIHAEFMAIGKAAELGIATGTGVLYVTHPPCVECCKLIVAAGISAVVIGDGVYTSDSAEERLRAEFLLMDVKMLTESEAVNHRLFA